MHLIAHRLDLVRWLLLVLVRSANFPPRTATRLVPQTPWYLCLIQTPRPIHRQPKIPSSTHPSRQIFLALGSFVVGCFHLLRPSDLREDEPPQYMSFFSCWRGQLSKAYFEHHLGWSQRPFFALSLWTLFPKWRHLYLCQFLCRFLWILIGIVHAHEVGSQVWSSGSQRTRVVCWV